MLKDDLISYTLQVVKTAIKVNEATQFGVDAEYSYINDGFEFRIYKNKNIGSESLLWETVGFNNYEAELKLQLVSDVLHGILETGEFALPEEEKEEA